MSEIKLTHGRLGDLNRLFSYGEGHIGGRDTLVVVSAAEGEEEGKITFRTRPEKYPARAALQRRARRTGTPGSID